MASLPRGAVIRVMQEQFADCSTVRACGEGALLLNRVGPYKRFKHGIHIALKNDFFAGLGVFSLRDRWVGIHYQ